MRGVQVVDERPLAVFLLEADRDLGKRLVETRLDVGERRGAVGLRLADAEEVQVGTVEDEEGHETPGVSKRKTLAPLNCRPPGKIHGLFCQVPVTLRNWD